MSGTTLRFRGPRHLDRTLALELGEVGADGIELSFDVRPTIDGGLEALRAGECELAEIPLGPLLVGISNGEDSLAGLPVFLSRRFPHRFLWVAAGSDLETAADLDGRRIGWAPGSGAAAAWSRQLLTSAGAEPEYVLGAMGGSMAAVLDLGREPGGETLPESLLAGRIDALATPYPVPPEEGGDGLRPLIRDGAGAERAWVRDGGPLPMTTVLAGRREALEGVSPTALLDAFEASRQAGQQRLRYPGAPAVALPWLQDDLAEIDALFGGSAFPYGLTANAAALAVFASQSVALGICATRVEPEQLFDRDAAAWQPA